MKKVLVILTLISSLAFTAQAQFINWGVRGGVGLAGYVDDVAASSPILGANAGVYVSYAFTNSQSLLAESFCLQTGLNFTRRGTNFKEVFEKELNMSIREGSYVGWYAQIPILATVRYELPIRTPGHRVLFSVGPAVSYGVFGTRNDYKISPGMPQRTWNYRINEDAFKELNRLDFGFIVAAGYEYKDLTLMLHFDYGMLAVSEGTDVLKSSENANYGSNNQAVVPNGNNIAVLLTVGYQFPIR